MAPVDVLSLSSAEFRRASLSSRVVGGRGVITATATARLEQDIISAGISGIRNRRIVYPDLDDFI
jgi:hypothetical protein